MKSDVYRSFTAVPYAVVDDNGEVLDMSIVMSELSDDVQPITYLRGRSLTNSVIIIEEAQNLSRVELLNVLSRVG